MTTATRSAVTTYAEDVLDGRVAACKWVRLAAARHLRDLAASPASGFYFDDETASWAVAFFDQIKHSKGEWAGQPLHLQPWQQFIVGSLFGWLRTSDGTRRFRVAYVEVPRKNGKSTLAAGIGTLLAFFDDEPGAEVYAAATKRDQAKIVWSEARAMVLASTNIRRRVRVLTLNLNDPTTGSKFEPLGADADSLDGLNMSGGIVDELHAHKTRAMWDVLETATGARRQPMTFAISTAGFNRQTVCFEQHDYGTKILEQVFTDETFFAFIATIDEDDDWADPVAWTKANPNLGISVKLDDLERKCEKAKLVPGEQNAFLRLHLDVWTRQATRWLSLDLWDKGKAEPPRSLAGRPCFASIDLSTTTDITALVLWFPDDEGGGDVLCFFFVPEERILERARTDRVPYDYWAQLGYIWPTEGNVVDYDVIRAALKALGTVYDIREVAFDRWNSTQLQTQAMGDGFTVVPFGQGFATMTAPTKELQKLLLQEAVRHAGNPVLRWMAENVAVSQDSAGNLKPAKDKSSDRIDGIVALIMAIGRAMVHVDEPEPWHGIYLPGDEDSG